MQESKSRRRWGAIVAQAQSSVTEFRELRGTPVRQCGFNGGADRDVGSQDRICSTSPMAKYWLLSAALPHSEQGKEEQKSENVKDLRA